MRKTLILICTVLHAVAADKPGRSVEKQRQSVLRQLAAVSKADSGSFFVSPWLNAGPPAPVSPNASCEPLSETRISELIADAARQHDVSPLLLRAVIRRESNGRPCAVSDKGAAGLMQLMPATQQQYGVSDPFEPAHNVAAGARYLADLLARYKGDLSQTLAAFNAGPQRLGPGGELPDIPETKAYVAAILAELEGTQEKQ